jgi:galactonate dehydratase
VGFLPLVTEVHRWLILNPFRSDVAHWFSISANHCQVIEIVIVETDDPNIVGFGETMIGYIAVPHKVTNASIGRVKGRQVSEFMFDDSVGAGLQMALLDATGKALEVPVHKLFERAVVRDSCPVSWWDMEAPAQILATEAERAVSQGYLSHKIKARPWFDIYQQLEAIDTVTPPNYQIDIDWNGQLLDAERAIPVIKRLLGNGKIGLFEDPIPRDDVQGQRRLLDICDKPLLTHFFEEWAQPQMDAGAVSGYVIDGGVSRVLTIGAEIDRRGMEGFIQLCGSGLTVALSLHLGAVIKGAKHPYVSMVTSFTHEILKKPPEVIEGYTKVPQDPGLGVLLDETKLNDLALREGYPLELPRRIYSFDVGDGRVRIYTSVDQLWADTSLSGDMPVQPERSSLGIRDDDGSQDFDSLFRRAAAHPVWVS